MIGNWGSIAFGKRFVGEIAEALAPDANSSHFLLKSTFDGMGVQLLHRLMLAMRNKRRRCFAKLSSPSSLVVRPYFYDILDHIYIYERFSSGDDNDQDNC